MKLFVRKENRKGIAMTEYLIILAVVAIAAILVVGLFGKNVKDAFVRSTGALAGKSVQGTDATTTADAADAAKAGRKMDDFGSDAGDIK